MQKQNTGLALLLVGALSFTHFTDTSGAHGGTYKGPGDTVPPGGGGGSGGSGSGPSGPASPSPSGPSGPGRSSPGRNPGGPTAGPNRPKTPRGTSSATDLTEWEFWWGFNREPYLNLKAFVHSRSAETGSDDFYLGKGAKNQASNSLRPSQARIQNEIVPALLATLDRETQPDIVTGCLIALAKIGEPKQESGASQHQLAAHFVKYLGDNNQEIRETAALSLGILGEPASLEALTDLALNTAQGRKLVSRGAAAAEVSERTRSFAIFGMGLVGARLDDTEAAEVQRQSIVQNLVFVLNGDGLNSSQRDLSVAALVAMGLVPLERGSDTPLAEKVDCATFAEGGMQRAEQIEWLLCYYEREEVNELVRAHCPTAMARLLQGADPRQLQGNQAELFFPKLKVRVCERLLVDLGPHSKAVPVLQQSCVQALGLLADSDAGKLDQEMRTALMEVPKHIADHQARHFALIALGLVGARPGHAEESSTGLDDIRGYLGKRLSRGRGHVPAWAALGLGVLERGMIETGRFSSQGSLVAARRSFGDAGAPREIGSMALALGLMKDLGSTQSLLGRLDKIQEPATQGHCALGLGLIGNKLAVEPIQSVVKRSSFRPELLRTAATALGLLGDRAAVDQLVSMLQESNSLSSQAALAGALGTIGDVDAVGPLIQLMGKASVTASARGLAAAALGRLADKEPLPWNAKLACNLNYRAATHTLTNSNGTGVLDLL